MKNILIVGYSQTGQLHRVLNSIHKPLINQKNITVDYKHIQPWSKYAFPWSFWGFFGIFPECAHMDAPPNKPLILKDNYDLIILGYQPWFLAPSLPTVAFLESEQAKHILKNTSVITVIACRNMWIQAQQKMVTILKKNQARLIDNVVLVDKGSNLSTFITTPRWLLTGKNEAFWGFASAGISDEDIIGAKRFGKAILQALEGENNLKQPILTGLGAVKVNFALWQSEAIGNRSFYVWGKIIRIFGLKNNLLRKSILLLYIIFLLAMIVTIVPISLLLRALIKPVLKKQIRKLENKFEQPSGSSADRLAHFL
jgi:hypothetical protein